MKGTILFAHGSRDPQWHAPMQAVAQRMAELAPGVRTRCAYLELTTPSLAQAADELVALGVNDLTVVPLFLGLGKHLREDLPGLIDALRQQHPGLIVHCQPAIGSQAAVIELLAELALGRT